MSVLSPLRGGGGGLLPASSGQKPGVMLNVLKCTDRRRRPRPSRQRPRRQTPALSAVRSGPGGVPEGRPAVMCHEPTERATAWDTGVRRDTPLDLTSGHTAARTPGREKQTPRAGRGLRTEPGVGLVPRGPRAECGAPRGCQRSRVGREAGTAQAASGKTGRRSERRRVFGVFRVCRVLTVVLARPVTSGHQPLPALPGHGNQGSEPWRLSVTLEGLGVTLDESPNHLQGSAGGGEEAARLLRWRG